MPNWLPNMTQFGDDNQDDEIRNTTLRFDVNFEERNTTGKIIARTGDVLVAVGAISANVGGTSLGLGGECYGTVTSVGQAMSTDVMVRLQLRRVHHAASMNLVSPFASPRHHHDR